MTLKNENKELRNDKNHLADMNEKLGYELVNKIKRIEDLESEIVELSKIIREIKEQRDNLIGDNLGLKLEISELKEKD